MSLSWLITGASSGLGYALAIEALRAGYKVVGATRNVESASRENRDFARLGGIWEQLDLSSLHAEHTTREIVAHNDINVVVNCAGCLLMGVIEDITDEEMKSSMNTNFHGPHRVIRGALPHLRSKQHTRRATIVNVSSGAGLLGRPARGAYAASKFALEGMSESLAAEVAPINIRVLLIEPGAFRTPFAARGLFAEQGGKEGASEPYRGSQAHDVLKMTAGMTGDSPLLKGDPVRAAKRIVEIVSGTGMAGDGKMKGSLRVFLGEDMLGALDGKIKSLTEDRKRGAEIARSTTFVDG